MITNRSVPANAVPPHVAYPDVPEAIEWLAKTFGFREHYRYGDPVSGAQVHLGDAWVMLKRVREDSSTPAQLGRWTQSLSVFVEDVEAHFAHTKAAGAGIVEDLHETIYGELQYGVEDFAGHHWLFSRHAHDRNPADWGATVAEPAAIPPRITVMLAVNDGNAAIEFYKAAFGAILLWQIEGEHTVAGLSVEGTKFFLATEALEWGTQGPAAAGFTTVRIELFVDDPPAVHRRAVAAGAIDRSPVEEHAYPMSGPQPIKRMLQGSVLDPFGHMWLIGKILEE